MSPDPERHSFDPCAGTARSPRGFSLIELLIVVAIVGILGAIAYPSYGTYVTKTRRSDAQFSLLDARQAMERCRSTSYTYVGCTVPTASKEGHYSIALSDQASTTFTLTATPVATGPQANDTDCASMTINQLDQPLPAICWD